jgi:hypothetical protein
MSRQGMIVGLFSGGVKKFVAPDGHPLITAIRKSPIANGLSASGGEFDRPVTCLDVGYQGNPDMVATGPNRRS